jgi:hypothetical protein
MGQKLALCSLTKMCFTGESFSTWSSWIDFTEPLATRIYKYKSVFQELQFTILDGKPNNLVEIGRFEKLDEKFEKIIKLIS